MWYYLSDGQQVGPIGEAELLALATQGEITPETMVWKQGLPQWQPFAVVKADLRFATSEPPPGEPVALAPLPPVEPKRCGLALTSMILGLCSVLLCVIGPLLGIPAVIYGHIAKRKIRDSRGALTGGDLATTGLVTGYLGMLLTFPVLAIVLLGLGDPSYKARRISCMANLKQIGISCKMYRMDYQENFPNSFEVMMKEKYLDADQFYVCPSNEQHASFDPYRTETRPTERNVCLSPEQIAELFAEHQYDSYLYFGAGETESSAGSDTVIAADRDGNHRKYFNVLFGDGHVQGFTGPDLETIARENHWRIPGVVEP